MAIAVHKESECESCIVLDTRTRQGIRGAWGFSGSKRRREVMTINQVKVLMAMGLLFLSMTAKANDWNQWGNMNQQQPVVQKQIVVQPMQFAPLPKRNTESHADTFLRQVHQGADAMQDAANILDSMDSDE